MQSYVSYIGLLLCKWPSKKDMKILIFATEYPLQKKKKTFDYSKRRNTRVTIQNTEFNILLPAKKTFEYLNFRANKN